MKTVPCQSFCGIQTCNEPIVSTTWTCYKSILPLLFSFFASFTSSMFLTALCSLSASVYTSPPTAPAWKAQGVLLKCMGLSVHKCVCLYMTSCAPHTIRTSGSDLHHLLSRQVMFPFACASLSVCLFLVCLTHRQLTLMGSQTTEPGYRAFVLWHLPECRVTDISHPAVTDDGGEQGQLFFLVCPREPWRPFGSTLLWCLNLRQRSNCMLTRYSKLYILFHV